MSNSEYFSVFTTKENVDRLNSVFKNENGIKIEALEEFITKFKEDVKNEFKRSMEAIEEDVVIFRAYMLKAKESYTKALQEEQDSMYALWEEFDKKRSENRKKVESILSDLKPIKEDLLSIKDLITEIDNAAPKWQISGMIETLSSLNRLMNDSSTSELAKFVIENYRKWQVKNEN